MAQRKPVVAGNWKMNLDVDGAKVLARELMNKVSRHRGVEVVVCPSFVLIPDVTKVFADSTVGVGGQDISVEAKGAFTGESSGSQLVSVGCRYVIVGHSERRQYHLESDELVGSKVKAALAVGLIPVFCIGERKEERVAGKTFERIERQVKVGLNGLFAADMEKVIVAYEPVWAIGTGDVATPAQAQEVHEFIRGLIKGMFGDETAAGTRILYGGSVNADNASVLMGQTDVDGALVGGASLKSASFSVIVEAAGV